MDSYLVSEQLHEHTHDEEGNKMFGFIVFLLSESVIFLSFFAGYIIYKTTTPNWLPIGVSGLEVKEPAINTVVLVASSFVIYLAERALQSHKLMQYRLYLLTTMAMGTYFLVGQGSHGYFVADDYSCTFFHSR
jgi:cytochrome c oxidase subunit III